ncbi:MAG: hypothetical protein ABSG93_03700 [Solirubrobacteraceae bacterium]|jgi:hypothetical protein
MRADRFVSVVDADGEDWLLGFLYEFASMSEEERDAAVDALSPADRHALVALAEARAATADADLIEVLDAGQGGLDKLYELTQPADLYAVIDLAAREHPNLVVEALFAAVVLHRGWDQEVPAAMVALREGWHWHVHAQLEDA